VKLREETAATLSVEREFARFMEAEKQRTQAALRQARLLKAVATALALLLFGAVLLGGLYYLRHQPPPSGP